MWLVVVFSLFVQIGFTQPKPYADRLNEALKVFQARTPSKVYQAHVMAMNHFMVRLYPLEQEIYLDLIDVYAHYHDVFENMDTWVREVRVFEPYFSTDRIDPSLIAQQSQISSSDLNATLQHLSEFWATLLLYQEVIPLPAWAVLSKETEDICARDQSLLETNSGDFQWKIRFEKSWTQYIQTRAYALKNPIDWHLNETDTELEVLSDLILDVPLKNVIHDAASDIEALFARIFTWEILNSEFDGETLTIRIRLETEKEVDLNFYVLKDPAPGQYTLFFILDIPFGKMKAALSQWEIVYQVKSHAAVPELTQVHISSRTVLTHKWAKNFIKLDKVRVRLQEELPAQLDELYAYLSNL